MSRPPMRSYTGAFGFGADLRDEILALEGQLAERARRRTPQPFAAVRPPPAEEEEDVEPVTVDLGRQSEATE